MANPASIRKAACSEGPVFLAAGRLKMLIPYQ